jgi:hypothetical protein
MHSWIRVLVCSSLAAASPFLHAQEASVQAYDDWSVSVSEEVRIARTSNELATVGVGCMGISECFAYLGSKVAPCREGESTALLLSSPTGSASTRATCKRINGSLLDVFEDIDALSSIALNETGFKVVVPLGDGAFQISGFSSRGAISALRTLSAPAIRRLPDGSI